MVSPAATHVSVPGVGGRSPDRLWMMRREHRRCMWQAFSQSFPNSVSFARSLNTLLNACIIYEKQRRWTEVLDVYGRMSVLFEVAKGRPELQAVFTSNPMLEFEFYSSYGWALQKNGKHKMAIFYYTRGLDSVFIPKSGCTVNCIGNSCLMAPLYGHRAISYGKIGELRKALSDSELQVQLDRFNPDAYCCRALIRSSRHENQKAIEDLQTALSLQPQHKAATFQLECLRRRKEGSRVPPPVSEFPNGFFMADFTVPSDALADFIDRFLPTFHIPRTIRELVLPTRETKEERGRSASRQERLRPASGQTRPTSKSHFYVRRNYNRPWTGDATPFVPRKEIIHASPFYV